MLCDFFMVCAFRGYKSKEEPETARLIACDLVKVTIWFEGLAISVEKSAKKRSFEAVLFRQSDHDKFGRNFFCS
jgi:hypothetical protein